jgi:hypothetical protein
LSPLHISRQLYLSHIHIRTQHDIQKFMAKHKKRGEEKDAMRKKKNNCYSFFPQHALWLCVMAFFSYSFFFYLKQSSGAGLSSAHGLALLLHDLADLHGRVEELCGAAVEADGLALVELALAVVGRNALLLAGLLQTVLGSVYYSHSRLSKSAWDFFFHVEVDG